MIFDAHDRAVMERAADRIGEAAELSFPEFDVELESETVTA